MKLTKVVYLNLERHKERNETRLAWLESIGVPPEDNVRMDGIDAAVCASQNDIIEAGNRKYPELRYFEDYRWSGKGDVAYAWAIRTVIRYIMRQPPDTCCIALLDDCQLIKDYEEYKTLAHQVGDLDIIQLAPWMPARDESQKRFYEKIDKLPPLTPVRADTRFIHGAPYPGEHAMIYSQHGAFKLKKALTRKGNAHVFPEGINEYFGHGNVWRIISVADPKTDPWANIYNDFSYREDQNA